MKYWCCAYWWEDNIKTDLQEVGWEGKDWMDLAKHWDKQ
jgi:hypothetical protein